MKRFFYLLLAAMLLCGCAAGKTGRTAETPPREKRLTVAAALPEALYAPLISEFESRTGIWVETVTGSTDALLEACAEGRCDLIFGVQAGVLEANRDLFAPVETDARLAPELPVGSNWLPVSCSRLVIVYNPILVKNNPPKGYEALTDSLWRGQLVLGSPEKCDASLTVLAALAEGRRNLDAEAFLRSFAANLGMTTDDCAAAVELVAQGRYCMTLATENLIHSRKHTGSLAEVKGEKTWVSTAGAAICRDADDPENARAFLEFLLDVDTQRYSAQNLGTGSVLKELYEQAPGEIVLDSRAQGKRLWQYLSLWEEIGGQQP